MKKILFLAALILSSLSFAGDAYLTCFDSDQEIVDSKYVDLYSDEVVQIEFSDMSTDKYYFEISLNPQSRELTYKVFDINSLYLIEESTQVVNFYDEINLVSGYMCSLVD